MSGERPRVAVFHHLARTGGTLLSRCLASVEGVTLLSEIHPRGEEVALQFDPLHQAQYWFKLLAAREVRQLREQDAPFAERMAAIAARVAEREECLVLRDWSHADFMAKPVFEKPTERFSLVEALSERFEVRQAASVRHPLPQWLSWQRYAPDSGLTLTEFMRGCRRFAEQVQGMVIVRYEDFLANPDGELARLCLGLGVAFEEGWANRWIFHRSLSGDLGNLESMEIRDARAVALDASAAAEIEADPDYQRTLELLGYEPYPAG